MADDDKPRLPPHIVELGERLRSRETELVRWLQKASPDEKDALVDLLVALELGQTRN